jgi:Zn-finger protein
VTQIIERVEGHYEVQAVEMGTVYIWCPESVVIECDCEQTFTTEGAMVASCPRCGAEHTGEVARELGSKPLAEEEAYRPVRRVYEAWMMKDEGNHRRHSEGLYGGGLFSGLAAKDERNRILDVLYGS